MSQHHGDEMEYVAEDNDMDNVDDDLTKWNTLLKRLKCHSRARFGKSDESNSDDNGYNPVDTRRTDTTAAEARMGKDIQGIPWDRLRLSREKYRQTRLEQYRNFENIPHSGERSEKYLDQPGVSFCSRTTYGDNAATNAIEIYEHPSGAVHFMASNNDCGVRDFDMERFQLSRHFCFPWPVNHTSLSPDGKLLAIVGDNPKGILVDSQTGKTIAPLCGQLDYSFASAWHPDGRIFATGNQDKTCRVWDVRILSHSLAVLKGNITAIRSIRFTTDGQFMAMAEQADFVHVYDAKHEFEKEQEIDFFGEISGVSFSPDTKSIFIGVYDRTYGSLLQFNRCREEC